MKARVIPMICEAFGEIQKNKKNDWRKSEKN